MKETDRIADQIDRAYRDGFWGGGPIGGLLRSLSVNEASAYPIPGAHSAWEIGLHIGLWHDIFRSRIAVNETESVLESDWPAPPGTAESDWEATLADLERGLERLVGAVRDMEPERLHSVVSGRKFTVYEMLHGIPQHDHYHAGQVMMLRKIIRGRAR